MSMASCRCIGRNNCAKRAHERAHASQFPKGEEDLGWLKAIDGRVGARRGGQYAEAFKQLSVW
jgi:hypothetical protein